MKKIRWKTILKTPWWGAGSNVRMRGAVTTSHPTLPHERSPLRDPEQAENWGPDILQPLLTWLLLSRVEKVIQILGRKPYLWLDNTSSGFKTTHRITEKKIEKIQNAVGPNVSSFWQDPLGQTKVWRTLRSSSLFEEKMFYDPRAQYRHQGRILQT